MRCQLCLASCAVRSSSSRLMAVNSTLCVSLYKEIKEHWNTLQTHNYIPE